MSDNFPDVLDAAVIKQSEINDDAILRISRKCLPETHPDFDGIGCVTCGESLPEVRLKLGRVRCVTCQEKLEIFDKFKRR